MPVYWTPAWVRCEAPTQEAAVTKVAEVWSDEGQEVYVVDGIHVLVMADDAATERGDLTDNEEDAEDESRRIASRTGFAPSPAQILASRGLTC